MRKVFLYLYPIKEYASVFTAVKDYIETEQGNPFNILNKCIEKRYKEQDFEIIVAIYPDKEVYGIDLNLIDKLIETDVAFQEATCYDINGNDKPSEEIKYPSEKDLFNKIGKVEEIIIAGYHFSDCVKRTAEYFNSRGVDTLVDLELTDLFFNNYYKEDFCIETYNLALYKQRFMDIFSHYGEFANRQFNKVYGSPIYGFQKIEIPKKGK